MGKWQDSAKQSIVNRNSDTSSQSKTTNAGEKSSGSWQQQAKQSLDSRGYFEPDYQKTYDDTVKQMKKDLREQLKEEYPKFLYYDEKTLTNFVVQSCWSEAELSKEYELLDAKFVCEYDPTAVILYGSEDLYKKMNFFEKLRCNRNDLNIDNWTEAEIETELRENAEKVEYNDIIYYKLIKQVSANESEETDDTAELTCLFCVKNGCGYTFQYGQNENTDPAAYNDFEAMLETVEYPNVYADENISLNPSEIIFSVIFSICLLLSIFTVINKKCKKGSTKMTVNKKENYKQIRESKYAQAANEHLGMSWFKFTINFRLIFGIIQYIMNFTKSYQNNTDDISLIIITGIIYTCFTFINIYVRQALANFRRNAVKFYFLLMYGFPALLNVLTVLITEEASSLVTIIGLLLLLIPELIYYKKRLHLFDSIKYLAKDKCSELKYENGSIFETENENTKEKAEEKEYIKNIETPYIDINGLAFSDEETIREAQKQSAEDLLRYFKKTETKKANPTKKKISALKTKINFENLRRKINMRNRIIPILYIIVLIVQIFFFVPYGKYEVHVSKQNVPHSEIIITEYNSLLWDTEEASEIENNKTFSSRFGYSSSKNYFEYDEYIKYKMNIPQLAIQLFATTLIFLALHLIVKKQINNS